MSGNDRRVVFTRKRGADRLIRTAKKMGLVTDGTRIWSFGDDGEVERTFLIDPDLLDRLAQIYANDGHDVRDSDDVLYDEDFSGERMDHGTLTVEEYRALVAEGKEPRVRFDTPPVDCDDMTEFDFADIATNPDYFTGFGASDRTFGSLDGLDSDPDWGGSGRGVTAATYRPAPTAEEMEAYEFVGDRSEL